MQIEQIHVLHIDEATFLCLLTDRSDIRVTEKHSGSDVIRFDGCGKINLTN